MQLSRADLLRAYKGMSLIREFDEAVHEEFAKGSLPGFVHLYVGEEASAMGVCMNLEDVDTIASNHRGHGHCIAKGCDITIMMKELYGKKDGICGGKGGSMHIADLSKGMLGANGIVGGGTPLILGAALTYKTKKMPNVSVGFFGDGASNQGSIAESMNMASVLNLPAVFVCEDNGFAESTGSSYGVAGSLVERGNAFGLRTAKVDGTDFFAVYETAKEIIDSSRNGEGPALIHVETNRVYGHFEGDAITYRTDEEAEDIKMNKDPLKIFKAKVTEAGLLEKSQLEEIDKESKKKIKQAIIESKEAAFPKEADLLTDVYINY